MYWQSFGDVLLTLVIILAYVPVVPLVAFAAILFFVMHLIVDKTNLVVSVQPHTNNDGRLIPWMLLAAVVATILAQLLFLLFLSLKLAPSLCIILYVLSGCRARLVIAKHLAHCLQPCTNVQDAWRSAGHDRRRHLHSNQYSAIECTSHHCSRWQR